MNKDKGRMMKEIRNPKSEGRKKAENRNPKSPAAPSNQFGIILLEYLQASAFGLLSDFGLRISAFFCR
jgi:hypothetical protein